MYVGVQMYTPLKCDDNDRAALMISRIYYG
jgi:hypothetical protein